jgi:hypothetical protein
MTNGVDLVSKKSHKAYTYSCIIYFHRHENIAPIEHVYTPCDILK